MSNRSFGRLNVPHEESNWYIREREFWQFGVWRRHLDRLNDRDKELVYLSKWKNIGVGDVAKLVRMPEPTVTYHIRMSYDKLRRCVELERLDICCILRKCVKNVSDDVISEVAMVIRSMSFAEVARRVRKTQQNIRMQYKRVRNIVMLSKDRSSYNAKCLFLSVE